MESKDGIDSINQQDTPSQIDYNGNQDQNEKLATCASMLNGNALFRAKSDIRNYSGEAQLTSCLNTPIHQDNQLQVNSLGN